MTTHRAPAHDNIERGFRRCGQSRYVLDVADYCVVLDVDRVHRDRSGTLRGELTVRCDLPGAQTIDGIAWSGEMCLSDTRGRRDIVQALTVRARTSDLQWALLIDELAMRVRDAERVGEPAVVLRDVAPPGTDELLDIHGIRLPLKHPSIIFGDGAAGKSYLALYIAGQRARAGHRVGIFDWELDAADHRDRLGRLYGDDMPAALVYVRCSRPLVHEIDRLAGLVHQHGLTYAVLDSIGFACAGPPENAEHATEYMRALRSLGIGTLNLAHTTKAGDAMEHRPFGSTFWHAGARMTWFLKAESTPGASTLTIGCFNRKANLGPLLPSVGLDVDFSGGRTTFRPVDLAQVKALAAKMTTYERIIASLKHGPRTVASLAEELGTKVDTVEHTCKRWHAKNRLIRLEARDGQPVRYGLAELRRVE
jgi:AAA domain